ncbi:hypothetical protein ACHAW6_000302 [Cyclotella cf. meneghiniana]
MLDVVLVAYLEWGPLAAGIVTTMAEWMVALAFLGVLAGIFPGVSLWSGGQWPEQRMDIVPLWELLKWDEKRPLIMASSLVFLHSIVLQIAMSSGLAHATTSRAALSSVTAHQVALQLWLLCSFLCNALAMASQVLVANGIGWNDPEYIKSVTKMVF